MAKVSGGQPYEIVLAVGEERSDGSKTVRVEVVWEKPVTSRGPWSVRVCQKLVTLEWEGTWRNLRSVDMDIELEEGRVASLSPGHVAEFELGAVKEYRDEDLQTIRVVEQPAGWKLKGGSDFKCPEGYEDEPQ